MTWEPDNLHRKTNNVPRDVIYGHETTPEEREKLDYVDWEAVERGEESFSGFRYRGELYDLSEFEAVSWIRDHFMGEYDGWQTESCFSAVAIKYVENYERVVVTYLHW